MIPDGVGTKTVRCLARRREGVSGGGYYYLDGEVMLEDYVARGGSVTVTPAGEGAWAAATVQEVSELQDAFGSRIGWKLILGHTA